MTAMHPLLRLALATCPRDYRREYEESIARDVRTRHESVGRVALDLLFQGIAMRIESCIRDLVLAARTLWRVPMYSIVAIAAIALAIGANVAVASVLQGVLMKPLPYANADRIVSIAESKEDLDDFSFLDGRDVAAQNRVFEHVGMSRSDSETLTGAATPALLTGRIVTGDYFAVFGAHAQLGRLFNSADFGTHNVVISDQTWRADFGADPHVVGRIARLDDIPYTIAGVLMPEFRDPKQTELTKQDYWLPADPRSNIDIQRGYGTYQGWALLRNGVSISAASADLHRIVGAMNRRYSSEHATVWSGSQVRPILDLIVGPVRTMLWLLYLAVGILLIIACANVANLTLVRAAARERELTVRSALGASRARLAVQLCTEMSLLALAGGVLGVILGQVGLSVFATVGAQMLPRWESVHIDGVVLLYVAGLIVLTTLASGLVPALAGRRDLVAGLKAAGRSGDLSGAKRLRAGLVVAEIALAIAVVICGGLIVRSFITLTHVSLGFDAKNVYVVQAPDMPKARYPKFMDNLAAGRRLAGEIEKIPGVREVALATVVPFEGGFTVTTIVPGYKPPEDVDTNAVSPGYFHALGIPLLRGRDFDSGDRFDSQQVAIVSAAFAKRYFHTLNVVGRAIHPEMDSGEKKQIRAVVGVVGDMRESYGQPVLPAQYEPQTQIHGFTRIVVRTTGHDAGFAGAVSRAFTTVDPGFAPPLIEPYSTILARDAGHAQAAAMLFSALGLIALALALAGIYGVTAYSVEQRTPEFGVRKAIGATDGLVLRNVISAALQYSIAGIVIGLVLAAAFARLLASILFQTSPLDPLTFAGVAALIVACTVLAALLPALRATRVQPAQALRYE